MESQIFHRPLPVATPLLPLFQVKTLQRKFNFASGLPSTRLRCQLSNLTEAAPRIEYKRTILDDWFLRIFRERLAEEVGWDSESPGYDGLMDVVNHLMLKGRNKLETEKTAVRVLRSLFPSWLLELFKLLISPLGGGKIAAMMVARVTAFSCQWLMGRCTVNSIDLPNGSSWRSGVFVEKCKYLEESKCIGTCVHTCKLPTQTFFRDYMGVPLTMEPDFSTYSCQFSFGVLSPPLEQDPAFDAPCLQICPRATRRREMREGAEIPQCPVV